MRMGEFQKLQHDGAIDGSESQFLENQSNPDYKDRLGELQSLADEVCRKIRAVFRRVDHHYQANTKKTIEIVAESYQVLTQHFSPLPPEPLDTTFGCAGFANKPFIIATEQPGNRPVGMCGEPGGELQCT
jgi:hypothetical protein